MVSFSCNSCQDTLKKPKLVQHFQRCHAPFTCLDCNKEMWDGEFQKHTTCISEAEKYEKTLYKGDKKKGKGQQQQQQQQPKQNAPVQQTQQKSVETAPAAPAVVATPPVPSTSAATTNGTATKTESTLRQAVTADVKAGPSTVTEPVSGKKDKKRKRRSEAAKVDTEAGNTSDAQIAKALVAEAPADKAAPALEPTPTPETTVETPEVKSEEKKSRKRHKKDKSKIASTTNGDASAMQVDKPAANGVVAEAVPVAAGPSAKVDLKETLTSKIPEKGKSISLADALADLPADKIQEALAGLRVQKGKKDKYELSVGYA